MKNVLFWGGILLVVGWIAIRGIASIQFDQNCEGYLKRAADANNIELAREELSKAISYIESKGLTSGYTSIFYKTPDEDLGFWYKNLKASLDQLQRIDAKTISDLEESNLLMKLRETLMDSGKSGSSVTVPDGISVYPNNSLLCWGCGISCVILAIGWGWKKFDEDF